MSDSNGHAYISWLGLWKGPANNVNIALRIHHTAADKWKNGFIAIVVL